MSGARKRVATQAEVNKLLRTFNTNHKDLTPQEVAQFCLHREKSTREAVDAAKKRARLSPVDLRNIAGPVQPTVSQDGQHEYPTAPGAPYRGNQMPLPPDGNPEQAETAHSVSEQTVLFSVDKEGNPLAPGDHGFQAGIGAVIYEHPQRLSQLGQCPADGSDM